MRTWDEAVRNGLKAYYYQHTKGRRMMYLYGAKGEFITTRAQVEYYFKAEPNYFAKYSTIEKEEIISNIIKDGGAYCYDCSGFVGWVCTGDKQYSYGQYLNSVKDGRGYIIEHTLSDGVAGSILFTTFGGLGRHIGIDIGYGFYLHMGYEPTNKNIAEGKSGVVLGRLADGVVNWEHSTQSNVLDYTGADNR